MHFDRICNCIWITINRELPRSALQIVFSFILYTFQVSSPGVERIVRIPQELDRFKDLPMYVKYAIQGAAVGSPEDSDGVFKLVSFDMESSYCTWSIADVRKNREQAGKGRPLTKKQREWRLQTPFDSLRLVRLYSDC